MTSLACAKYQILYISHRQFTEDMCLPVRHGELPSVILIKKDNCAGHAVQTRCLSLRLQAHEEQLTF